jgi:hypothetical protein
MADSICLDTNCVCAQCRFYDSINCWCRFFRSQQRPDTLVCYVPLSNK